MRTIAIANQKGGCGKTTTAVNLAAALARARHRTLLIDLDPQAHATLGLGWVPEKQALTIYHVIVDSTVYMDQILCLSAIPGLLVAPSNVLLSGADSLLTARPDKECVLRKRLAEIQDSFDVCIIDCSPSLNILTLNALVASTEVLIPVQTHYYAIEGLRQMLETIDLIRQRFNPDLRLAGILLTLSEKRTLLSRDVQIQMRDYFRQDVLKTVIHRNVRLAEAPSAGKPIFLYDKHSSGSMEYAALAEELTHETSRITETDCIHI